MRRELTPALAAELWQQAFEAEAAASGLTAERVEQASDFRTDERSERILQTLMLTIDERLPDECAINQVQALLTWSYGRLETPPPCDVMPPIISAAVRFEFIRRMEAHGPSGKLCRFIVWLDARARACYRPFPVERLEMHSAD